MASYSSIHLVLLVVLIGTSSCQKANKRQSEGEEEEKKTTKAVTGTVVREGEKRFENCSLLITGREVERDGATQGIRDGTSSDLSESEAKDGVPLHLNGKLKKLFEMCRICPTLEWDEFIANHLSLRIISSLYEKLAEETSPDKCPSFVSETAHSMICDLVHGYVESVNYNYDYDRYYNHYDITPENNYDRKENDNDQKEQVNDHDSEILDNEFFKPYLERNWKKLFSSHFREH